METEPEKFHKTITRELKVLQNRVRYLIGDANWGEDGRYKEAVLRSIIRRFLPANISLGTGFILKKNETGRIQKSKQIDIIVYDNNYPVLFVEGEFIITTPENVRGIIEVKTRLPFSAIPDVLSKATENGQLMSQEIFNGVFVYASPRKTRIAASLTHNEVDKNIEKIIQSLRLPLIYSKGAVNHLCFGEDLFIKFWQSDWSTRYYSIYHIERLSFAYFISNLVEHLSGSGGMPERWWFLYPIKDGKEQYKIRDIDI